MCDDAADVLRKAADDDRTVSDAWQDQQRLNESISGSPTDVLERVLDDESRTDELGTVVSELVEAHVELSDV